LSFDGSSQNSHAPIVAVKQLYKRYGDLVALKGIDFELNRGEIFALLGPNGAGKSTCIEILEGFRRPSGGEVSVFGCDPQQHDQSVKERLGFVSQESGVELVQTPREVLNTYRHCYADGRAPEELLDLVGLSDKADSKISRLSGGQKRRLDLALGLVGNPELLFLDEPTTGFSPEARRESWRILLELKQAGMTILLTSHYMDEVSFLADRMAILVQGEIAFLGEPENLGLEQTIVEFVLPQDWSLAGFEAWLGTLPAGTAELELPRQPQAQPQSKVALSTADPTEFLYLLTQKAKASQISLEGLTVSKPTLEENYLGLIGRHSNSSNDLGGEDLGEDLVGRNDLGGELELGP